ncbi:MAG: MoaD/ThiS family protein [Candidatus Thorarchaeota archaeon]
MRVTLQIRGPLAKQFTEGTLVVEVKNNASLSDLLKTVIESQDIIKDAWINPEVVDRDSLILCNGADIGLSGGLDTKMNENDVVVVLPLIHGG